MNEIEEGYKWIVKVGEGPPRGNPGNRHTAEIGVQSTLQTTSFHPSSASGRMWA